MPPLRVAVATRCFDQPLRQALRTASGTGATGVQFDARNELRPAEFSATGRRELLHSLSELGLKPASLLFPTRRSLSEQAGLDARVAALKTVMQFAWDLNAPVVTLRAGRVPDDLSTGDGPLLVDVLNDLARHGNRVGATLALTPARDSADALLRLLAAVTEGPLGIDFDPVALEAGRTGSPSHPTAGIDAAAAFSRLHAHVAHVTVRDAIRDVDGHGVEVAVGRGEVGWDELAAVIAEAEYAGWQTVVRTAGDDRIGDITRGVAYLGNVLSGR